MSVLTKAERWSRDCDQVVKYITNNPGSTGRAIAFHTGISVNRVHRIIDQDLRAFELATEGYVAVQQHNMKPGWYHPSMTNVPVVRGSGINLDSNAEVQAINSTFQDEAVRAQVLDIYYTAKKAVLMPSQSMRKRQKASTQVMSGVAILGEGLQEKKREVNEIGLRLDRIEQLMLAGPARRSRARKDTASA